MHRVTADSWNSLSLPSLMDAHSTRPRVLHTAHPDEITLPEDFTTLHVGFEDSFTDLDTMADDHRSSPATHEAPVPPLFSPEQQAWIESLIRERTSQLPSDGGSTSSSANYPPPAPSHASTSSGNLGKLMCSNTLVLTNGSCTLRINVVTAPASIPVSYTMTMFH